MRHKTNTAILSLVFMTKPYQKFIFVSTLLLLGMSTLAMAQTPPFALSPKWVFGNKAMFDFTTGATPSQPARPAGDNIIANEGSSTLCAPNKNVMVYDNNVRIGGNNGVPLAAFMDGSSSSTQGGVIIPNPGSPTNQYFLITGNAESTYSSQETNDNQEEGIKVYSGSQSGVTVTNPTLNATLRPTGNTTPEQLVAGPDNNYGYWIIYEIGTFYANGDPNFNAHRVTTTGVNGTAVASTYSTFGNWGFQAQGSIKLNRCQNKIAIVQSTKIAVFEWNRATGQIGAVIKYITGIDVAGGSKLYGCEFSANGNYLYVSTLSASELIVVDLNAAGGIGTGMSKKTGQNASGTLQIGPNDVIYVANGLDGSTTTTMGTITNANTGGTYTPAGITLLNSSTVRLGIGNIPWLNPQRPTISVVYDNVCGRYTFTPSFLTHFNDPITINKAVWTFGDGSPTVTNNGASATNAVTHNFLTTGSKTISLTVTDGTCTYEWAGTLSHNVPCVLPVDLMSFTAEKSNSDVLLKWVTAQEKDNDYFEIQRSSDGINFTTIGTVKGMGNSSSIVNYSYTDESPENGTNYYRLVQHDFDGKSEPSEIIALSFEGIYVNIYPNPSDNEFQIQLSGISNDALVVVTDVLGREVYRKIFVENFERFSFGKDLPTGTYIFKAISENQTKTLKLVKQN